MTLQDFLTRLEQDGPEKAKSLIKELDCYDRKEAGIKLNAALKEKRDQPKPEPVKKSEAKVDWTLDSISGIQMEMQNNGTRLVIKLSRETIIVTGENLNTKRVTN